MSPYVCPFQVRHHRRGLRLPQYSIIILGYLKDQRARKKNEYFPYVDFKKQNKQRGKKRDGEANQETDS